MEFDPENQKHWVYLAKALAYSSREEGGRLSDQEVIERTNNDGTLGRSTLARFRAQANESHLVIAHQKLNNDVARRIWNFFIDKNDNPYVNKFAHKVDFKKYQSYIGLLDFFDIHPSKHSKLSKTIAGKFIIYSKSEMFAEAGKITRGLMDFVIDGDGLVISTVEHHRYSGHADGGEINHYYQGYAIERHSQIYIFSKSAHRATPRFMILDKRWTDQDNRNVVYMEGVSLKGSFGASPFFSKVYLVRLSKDISPDIVDQDIVDPLIIEKIM